MFCASVLHPRIRRYLHAQTGRRGLGSLRLVPLVRASFLSVIGVTLTVMRVTEKHVARIPTRNLGVTRAEFVAVWAEAERRREAAEVERRYDTEWRAAAVAETCRWLGGAALRRPATGGEESAYEELIEEEAIAAENMSRRQPVLARLRPGWCEGVRDTLTWAWWFAAPPPIMVPAPAPPPAAGMDVTDERVAMIPPGTFQVPRPEFVAVWTQAERRRGEAGRPDWYVDGAAAACRWLGGASFRAPASGGMRSAHEGRVESEARAAEGLAGQQPTLVRLRPGWCDGIRDTFTWAWRRQGPPPVQAASAHRTTSRG
jgi:hypothetical protein